MAMIKLTKGAETLVDACDFEWLNENKWCLGSNGYAVRTTSIKNEGGRKTERVHRLVVVRMGLDPIGLDVDHKNQNKLDNRRSNLRIVSRGVNCHNTKVRSNSSTGITGVWFHKQLGKYAAQIKINKRYIYLGVFNTLKEAAAARKREEAKHPEHYNYMEAK